jgi:hypothetical protein
MEAAKSQVQAYTGKGKKAGANQEFSTEPEKPAT